MHLILNINYSAVYLFCMISKIKVSTICLIKMHLYGHEAQIRHGHNYSINQLTLVPPSKHLMRVNCIVCFQFYFHHIQDKHTESSLYSSLRNPYTMHSWKFQFIESMGTNIPCTCRVCSWSTDSWIYMQGALNK
jgi:hypothetical protein